MFSTKDWMRKGEELERLKNIKVKWIGKLQQKRKERQRWRYREKGVKTIPQSQVCINVKK